MWFIDGGPRRTSVPIVAVTGLDQPREGVSGPGRDQVGRPRGGLGLW